MRVVGPDEEGLGTPTIMNPVLAAKYGVPYVRLAAFAIDVDRVRVLYEHDERGDSSLPFGWEVFLTEAYLLENFDPERDVPRVLVEEVVLDVVDSTPNVEVLGAQLPFALYDACARGTWPPAIADQLRRAWTKLPEALVSDLAPFWSNVDAEVVRCAHAVLDAPLDPPPAPPTTDALRWMIQSRSGKE